MSKKATIFISILFIVFVGVLISNSLLTHADQCTSLKQQVQSEIDSALSCSVDADCASYTFDCAFGCNKPVAKNQIEGLAKRSLEYARMCHHLCPACQPGTGKVRCINSLCQSSQ